jgi:hypothetical protein
LTGIFLRDFAQIKFDVLRDQSDTDSREGAVLTPSVLSTVGLRRATEALSIKVHNMLGFDVHVVPDSSPFAPESGLVANGSFATLEPIVDALGQNGAEDFTLCLRVSESAAQRIGDREPVYDLPIASTSKKWARLYLLRPICPVDQLDPGRAHLLRLYESRSSPGTAISEGTVTQSSHYNAEPVVEWCMHNQRLRSSIVDIFSLPKGSDLLSSSVWSPEDELNEDVIEYHGIDPGAGHDGPEAAAGGAPGQNATKSASLRTSHKGNWLKPYLKNDSPEWTDMTCTLRMARERVMLPDNNWIWVSKWAVDLRGKLGDSTDADGWEYQADFETFTRTSRYVERRHRQLLCGFAESPPHQEWYGRSAYLFSF